MNYEPETENCGSNVNAINSVTELQQFPSTAPSMHSLVDVSQSEAGLGRQPLSLVQLSHWLMEPKRRLEILAALADNCSSVKGGALVSKVLVNTYLLCL